MNVKVKSSQTNRSAAAAQQPMYQQPKKGNKIYSVIITLLVIVILAMGALWLFKNDGATNMASGVEVKKDQYQAIFLTNGQVYFGKLSKVGADYVNLEDIYYLQVQQPAEQPTTDRPAVQPSSTKNQPQVSLTKLGKELHGPEDKMYIARDQVLFWENLKNDSTVAKAIEKNRTKEN